MRESKRFQLKVKRVKYFFKRYRNNSDGDRKGAKIKLPSFFPSAHSPQGERNTHHKICGYGRNTKGKISNTKSFVSTRLKRLKKLVETGNVYWIFVNLEISQNKYTQHTRLNLLILKQEPYIK